MNYIPIPRLATPRLFSDAFLMQRIRFRWNTEAKKHKRCSKPQRKKKIWKNKT